MRSLKPCLLICLTLLLTIALFSCSGGSKDNPALPEHKPMKFTLTTTGLLATDDFGLTFGGGDLQGTKDIFKVNGVLQSNQGVIAITKEQLMAGPIVIETIPVLTVAVAVSGFSGTNGHSFSFKMEPVINGTPQAVINKTVTTTIYVASFSY